jgi:SAM-dependent methyltransferase
MNERARAQALARAALDSANPTGWFEQLYREAEAGKASVPWADLCPNPNLLDWAQRTPLTATTALVVGCGYGDDAAWLADQGLGVTAFDLSNTAVEHAAGRFDKEICWTAADLLAPPDAWRGAFDFVFEAYTLQAMPPELRSQAAAQLATFLAPAGALLVVCRGREDQQEVNGPPWPLTRSQVLDIAQGDVSLASFEDFLDPHEPGEVRRFRALFTRGARP